MSITRTFHATQLRLLGALAVGGAATLATFGAVQLGDEVTEAHAVVQVAETSFDTSVTDAATLQLAAALERIPDPTTLHAATVDPSALPTL
ncbi:hypothetical protein F8O01_09035 [Pseudoclavibacter chungangensis]|uniref:Uncharacterized protein n=1 Tax=Pseudoclavibacter chungangensis TaxID=587635 RepID=A0A7J5BRE2_9MICO|nr:hypothetical protein [Pseudoclavibacter chungangensis]KAB1656794.1 hypothetical protein F8O01_09035 [Pseudoclavibacter chungangensis]NYJ67243.1 hypothetical protein [Pseudoclavibacter chungangensis]